jgi:hypothetical protein
MSDWLPFFTPHFASATEASAFVDACESINRDCRPPDDQEDSTPKMVMHQTVRLISLADNMLTREHSHPLSLFFMIVCAESVSKLFDGHKSDSAAGARESVRKFFTDHVLPEDREKLVGSFSWFPYRPLTVVEVADLLYAIRCDVAHEGRYWGFSFPNESHRATRLNLNPKDRTGGQAVGVTVTLKEIRDIVVRGCIAAVTEKLRNRQPPP